MSQYKADRPQTFLAAAALANKYRCVKITAEYTVDVAGAGDAPVGVNIDTCDAAGKGVAVATPGSGQSILVTASGAITAGAELKVAASGKVTPAATTNRYFFRALEAASADGDIIEAVWEQGVKP